MQWMNRFNLPKPFVVLVMDDAYNREREEGLANYCLEQGLNREKIVHFSASDLIKPPRMRMLIRRHFSEIIKDVSQEVYRVLGQAIHHLLREAAIKGQLEKEGWIAERRLFCHFVVDGVTVVVSGEPDIVSPEGVVQDYKVTAVYSWMKQAKREWVEQTNIYAFLRFVKGLQNTGLQICYILRDWSLNETMQAGYPQAGAQMEGVELWDPEKTRSFILERIRLHLAQDQVFDDELPDCTDEEMWAKGDSWAVMREGNKVASKVYSSAVGLEKLRTVDPEASMEDAKTFTLREAQSDADERNARLKGKEAERQYIVEFRAGERTRCLRFCDAKSFCNTFAEYASTFKGQAKREPVEEIS